jgi:hypothetical protein
MVDQQSNGGELASDQQKRGGFAGFLSDTRRRKRFVALPTAGNLFYSVVKESGKG